MRALCENAPTVGPARSRPSMISEFTQSRCVGDGRREDEQPNWCMKPLVASSNKGSILKVPCTLHVCLLPPDMTD